MDRCRREAGRTGAGGPLVRRTVRLHLCRPHAAEIDARPNEQDVAKILYENGFDAIQGAGGYLNQLVDGHVEFLHRTSIYAPPAPGKENDPLRWNLSMRMLQLPNAPRIRAAIVGPADDGQLHHASSWRLTRPSTTSARCSTPCRSTKTPGRTRSKAGRTTPMARRSTSARSSSPTWASESRWSPITTSPIPSRASARCFAVEATNEQALAETLEKWMNEGAGCRAPRDRPVRRFGSACPRPSHVREAIDVTCCRPASTQCSRSPTMKAEATRKRIASACFPTRPSAWRSAT